MIRAASLALYAAFAVLAAALLAAPAAAWVRGLGLDGPVVPAEVPLGCGAVLLGGALAASVTAIAIRAALGRSPGTVARTSVLLITAAALALRAAIGDVRAGPDPAPRLVRALQALADSLDAEYARTHRYAATSPLLDSTLSALPPTGVVHRGRELRVAVRVFMRTHGAQVDSIPGDPPGTIYLSISPDEQSTWLSALSVDGVLPLTVYAHAGAHSQPGFDPLLPLYPRRTARK